MRYVLAFRLNRSAPKWPKDPDDPDGPAPLPKGAASPLGNITINGFRFDANYSIFIFDPVEGRDRDNCFFGRIATDVPDESIISRLDAIPDGGRVRVRMRLLTPKRNGMPQYGRTYVRHPVMIRARVKGSSYLQIVSLPALDALKRAGCAEMVLY